MIKVFCDKCEKECINIAFVGRFNIRHTTKYRAEIVAEDEVNPIYLCKSCAMLTLGQKLVDNMIIRYEQYEAETEAERRSAMIDRPIPRDEQPPIPGWDRVE